MSGMDENDVLQILCRVFDDGSDEAMDEWREWYKPDQWLHPSRALGAFIGQRVRRDFLAIRSALESARSALASQTRHATTLGAALSNSGSGSWQEDAWTDLPQLVYRPSCRPAPQRMESML